MDFKTVVHVYDNPAGRADILELQHPHLQDLPLSDQTGDVASHVRGRKTQSMGLGASVLVNGDYSESNGNVALTQSLTRSNGVHEKIQINQNGLPLTLTSDVPLSRTDFHDRMSSGLTSFVGDISDSQNGRGQPVKGTLLAGYQAGTHHELISSNLDPGYMSRVTPPRGSPRQSPTGPSYNGGSAQQEQGTPRDFPQNQSMYQNGNQSDVESESSSAMKNSVTSFESFQTKAMKAIRALDDVVANEPSELEYGAVLDTPTPAIPVPPPPPPLPPGKNSKLLHIPYYRRS